MPGEGVFLQSGDGLTVLVQRDYDSEALLQIALAAHPEVLAGPTTTGEAEGRLLLVRREMGVPSVQEGSNTFSLDHLFGPVSLIWPHRDGLIWPHLRHAGDLL